MDNTGSHSRQSEQKGQDMFFTANIDAGSPLKLTVNNTSGDIFISPEDVNQIEIEATLTSGTPNEGDHGDWIFETDGNTVSLRPNFQLGQTVSNLATKVKTQLKEGFRAEDWDLKKIRGSFDAAYDLVVRLPRELPADSTIIARCASGDLTVKDLTANVSATTASGDSHLSNLTGKISGHAASGDVKLSQIHGSVEANVASGDISLDGGEGWCALRSASGDITARNFTLKNARVATVNGDMTFDVTIANKADFAFDTVNGDIRLTTTVPSTGASLSYKAMSGDAKAAGEWISDGKNSWHLAAGSDGPRIAIKALHGNLRANAISSDDVSLTHEELPKDVQEDVDVEGQQQHLDDELNRMDGKVSDNEATGYGSTSNRSTSSDFDWDRTKGWLKDITGKVSQFVAEMDEAGERRRGAAPTTSPSGKTEPVVVEGTIKETPSATDDTITGETKPRTPDIETTPFVTTTDVKETEPIVSAPSDGTFATDDGQDPQPITPPTAPESTAERRIRLLEAVKRGEMTVDEALAKLDDDPNT